jgi:hypothetical protein
MIDKDFNAERVESAHATLMAFGRQAGPGEYDLSDLTNPEEFLAVAGDLIANLMHAADAAGVDMDQLLSRAILHYSAESNDVP